MATPQGDGSIILKTKVDTSGIKGGMSDIKGMVGKIGGALAAAFSVKKIYDFVKKSVDAFAEYEQLVGGVETLFKGSSKKVLEYANEAFRTTGQSANEYMQNVTAFSASLLSAVGGDTEKAAEVANAAMISISDNVNKMGSSAESVQLAFQGFAKQQYMLLDNLKLGYGGTKTEMERLLKDAQAITGVEYNIDNLADVYTAIGVIQEKLGIAGTTAKEAATTISGSAGMMRAAWQNVLTAMSGGGDLDVAINNFVQSTEYYFDNLMPVVEKAMFGVGRLIEEIAPKLAEGVGRALIASVPDLLTAVYAIIVGAAKGIFEGIVALFKGKTKPILEEQAESIEKSAENQEKLTENVKKTNKELKKTLAGFDDIQIITNKAAEGDLGVDAVVNSAASSQASSLDGSPYSEEVNETLLEIMAVAGPSLLAVGLILLFLGNIAWGIGLIIAGALTIGTVMGQASEFDSEGVIQMITTIMAVAGGALLALGIILLYIGGVVGMGTAIGMIIAGAVLIISAVAAQAALNPDDIKSWLTIILGIAGGALLALGVILCMVGSIGTGVALIVAGAVSVVAAAALNFDAVADAIRGPIGAIMAIVGAALLVIGIILVCCGVIPLGIALIAAGAVALVTPIAMNWDAIVDWVKGAWDAVKSFWNKYIAPVFTLQFWLDLAKKCGNGLIAGFEAAINGIIWLFESAVNFIINSINVLIDGVDAIVGVIGDLFGADWNVPRIPEVDFGEVKIPRLAKGGVIPPNREFLAVLGDQKSGTNIETPLSTMVDAFNMALDGRGEAVKEEHYYLSETELMSIVYKLAKGGERQSGNSLISGGVY